MGAYPEPTPFNEPFHGATNVLKQELSKNFEAFLYQFEHEDWSKSSMSRLLRLNETLLLSRAKEVGGMVYTYTQKWASACADFANGHGKLEAVYEWSEELRDRLRG